MNIQSQNIDIKDVSLNVEHVENGLQFEVTFTPVREASGMLSAFVDAKEGKPITAYRWLNSANLADEDREQVEAMATEAVEAAVNQLSEEGKAIEHIARSKTGFENADGIVRETNFFYELPGLPAEEMALQSQVQKWKSQEIETEAVALPTAE